MSTSTTPEPNPPTSGPIRIGPSLDVSRGMPVETAPSTMLAEGPTFARAVGFAGLFFLVLGGVVVISTRVLGPRWVPEGFGFLSAALGLALMLYHAVTDSEQEIRRMYGGFAAFWLLVAVVGSVVPGPFAEGATRSIGHFLLPWGVGAGFLALLFAIPFTRHETDETYRNAAQMILLVVGGSLAAGSVVAGIARPDFLAGPGLALAFLGLGFLCAYLSQVDSSEGAGLCGRVRAWRLRRGRAGLRHFPGLVPAAPPRRPGSLAKAEWRTRLLEGLLPRSRGPGVPDTVAHRTRDPRAGVGEGSTRASWRRRRRRGGGIDGE